MNLAELLLSIFPQRKTSPATRAGIHTGLYHYVREASGTATRFHLRVDSSGSGLLVAGATSIARLHPTGVIIARSLLENRPDEIPGLLSKAFGSADEGRVAADVDQLRKLIEAMSNPGDAYPILNLGDPAFSPQSEPLDRPLSADVPLAEPTVVEPILDRLWDLGIPHVTLLAGPEPEAAQLVRAVEQAAELGLIAGVRGTGTALAQSNLVADLAAAGARHVDVTYLSSDPQVHDALAGPDDHACAVDLLAQVRAAGVCPVVDVALVDSTFATIAATIESLAAHGVHNAGFFALAMAPGKSAAGALPGDRLVEAAAEVEQAAAGANVCYRWYPPVRFYLGRSLATEVRRGPRTSGDLAIRVEPDGSVILPRGPDRPAGNLLSDRWERIHRNPLYRKFRRRVETDTRCPECPGLAICAADCPNDPTGWATSRE